MLPPPLWGRVGEGGGSCANVGAANSYPHPQPLPTRGRGAHRVCGADISFQHAVRVGAPVAGAGPRANAPLLLILDYHRSECRPASQLRIAGRAPQPRSAGGVFRVPIDGSATRTRTRGSLGRRPASRRRVLRPEDRLEPDRRRAQRDADRDRRHRALSHPAHDQSERSDRGAGHHRSARHRARRVVRRGRLFHAHLLRPVRVAHDRARRRAVSGGGAGELHQLCRRP